MVKLTNDKGLERALQQSAGYVIVCFYQLDSTPCQHFEAEFDALSKKASLEGKATFLRIDALENPGIAHELDIKAVPTTLIMKKGTRVACFEGPYRRDALEGRILDLMGAKNERDA